MHVAFFHGESTANLVQWKEHPSLTRREKVKPRVTPIKKCRNRQMVRSRSRNTIENETSLTGDYPRVSPHHIKLDILYPAPPLYSKEVGTAKVQIFMLHPHLLHVQANLQLKHHLVQYLASRPPAKIRFYKTP
jgi:hypothetical protein